MGAAGMRARALLRANLRATIVLTLLAGITDGLALTAWSAARRGSSSFERFVASAREPNAFVFCESARGGDCSTADSAVVAAAFRRIPGVVAAAPRIFMQGTAALRDGPTTVFLPVLIGDGLPSFSGDPPVVEGRRADPARSDELVVPEEAARLYDVGVGDVVPFTPTPADTTARPETVALRVVGVVRTTGDLAAGVGRAAPDPERSPRVRRATTEADTVPERSGAVHPSRRGTSESSSSVVPDASRSA
jgi:hypothetical protein